MCLFIFTTDGFCISSTQIDRLILKIVIPGYGICFISVLALEIYGYVLAIYYKSVFPSCTFFYCFANAFFFNVDVTSAFLQLEDDIVVKQNYFSTIKNFALQLASEDWMILEFSQLGFIGKKMFTFAVRKDTFILRL